MARIAWATDTHFDCVPEEKILKLAEKVKQSNVEALILTGDISSAKTLTLHLSILERALQMPTYFVMGNHDFYGGYLAGMRQQMKELSNISGFLRYLPTTPYVSLTPSTALVGHDGWYDALYGDYKQSRFVMADWEKIGDFADEGSLIMMQPQYDKIVPKARELAHAAVQHVHDGIKGAVRYYKNIIVATHFPPWDFAHIYKDRVGSIDTQPWYTSKMMGDMLRMAARTFPEVQFTVLAGHTHGRYDGNVEKNMTVHVGAAEYGSPDVADVLTIG